MKTLVVPLDGSPEAETALPIADALSTRFGADVVLVSAIGDEPVAARLAYLQQMSGRIRRPGTRVEVRHTRQPEAAIVEIASSEPDALVCLSTHGRGAVGQTLIGSTADAVLRATVRPVLLVGPRCEPAGPDAGPMLVPLDGSTLANRIIPTAIAVAQTWGLQPALLHLAHPQDAESATHADEILRPALDLFAQAGLTVTHEVLFEYPPTDYVADHAREIGASLIVMGTHLRTGVRRLILGSVAMATVHHAPCPVLVQNLDGTAMGTD